MSLLATIGSNHTDLEGLLVCVLIAAVVAAVVYVVLVYAFHQAWGGLAAGLTFLILALFCIV